MSSWCRPDQLADNREGRRAYPCGRVELFLRNAFPAAVEFLRAVTLSGKLIPCRQRPILRLNFRPAEKRLAVAIVAMLVFLFTVVCLFTLSPPRSVPAETKVGLSIV